MLISDEKKRYSRQIMLPEIGIAGQEKLFAAKVLVIGAGGLGCPILQYLTAAGVGLIGVADPDTIDLSNLQRQVLYTKEEIGQLKADVAISKMRMLNTSTHFRIHREYINAGNALEVLKNYDIIIDGSDNFATRYVVNDACVILNKPMVSGAIYKFEGQVSVFNYNDGPTYRCIFPEPPGADESPNCADIGVIATLPGIVGTIQANEVIKMITGVGEVLSGKLLVIDTLTMNTHTFSFKAVPENKKITQLADQAQYCEPAVKSISYFDVHGIPESELQLVDVRETEEHEIENIGGINIPLSAFDASYGLFDRKKTIVLYCSSGTRSKHAARLLLQKGFNNILHLEKGINALIKH